MRILLVDDSKTMQQLALKVLGEAGFTNVVTCSSANEAMELLKKETVDLALLDWHMPGLTGIDLLRYMKNQDNSRNVPVFMLTTEDHPLSIQAALESGADGYLIKPLQKDIIQEKLAKLVK